jgi:uncharacterized protein (UPF0128 family)
MKFFNTAGPVNQEEHYKIDPLKRWDFDEVLSLINQKKYFVLHAPRQTGKTSSLLELQKYLNAGDNYIAVYVNFECGQAARNDIEKGIGAIVYEIISRFCSLSKENRKLKDELLIRYSAKGSLTDLNSILTFISEKSDKPLVLLINRLNHQLG